MEVCAYDLCVEFFPKSLIAGASTAVDSRLIMAILFGQWLFITSSCSCRKPTSHSLLTLEISGLHIFRSIIPGYVGGRCVLTRLGFDTCEAPFTNPSVARLFSLLVVLLLSNRQVKWLKKVPTRSSNLDLTSVVLES